MVFLKPVLFSNLLYILRIPSTHVLTVHQRHSIKKKQVKNKKMEIYDVKFERSLSKLNHFDFLTYFFENYTFFDSLQSFTDSDLILMSQIAGG